MESEVEDRQSDHRLRRRLVERCDHISDEASIFISTLCLPRHAVIQSHHLELRQYYGCDSTGGRIATFLKFGTRDYI